MDIDFVGSLWRRSLACIASLALVVTLCPAMAFATPDEVADTTAQMPLVAQEELALNENGNIAEGTWGTCPWEISADGVLTVHPGQGADNYVTYRRGEGDNGAYGMWISPWKEYSTSVKRAIFAEEGGRKVIAPSLTGCLLSGLDSLEAVDLSGLDTSNATVLSFMFDGCSSLVSLDVSPLDTSNVTRMWCMFYGCSALVSLNLTSFDTTNVEDMSDMFRDCHSLTSLDVSGFDTRNVVFMAGMFYDCSSLVSLDLASFDTSGVYDDSRISFYGCTALSRLSIGKRTVGFEIPDYEVNGHKDWYSKNAREWLTAQQIESSRMGIADTYAKDETAFDSSNSEQPGEPANPSETPTESHIMYRLYNPNSGEHFYTASEFERDAIAAAGWDYEGTAWTAPVESNTPVYRLYSGTDHHYTTSAFERDALVEAGWSYEGIGWYSDDAQTVGLHRLFNPYVDPTASTNNSGSHHYTTSDIERDHLVSIGWNYEDIGWYGM